MISTSKRARLAGLLYLIFVAFGVFLLLYIPNTLVSVGNPAATAANIGTHESLLRLGIALDLVGGVLALVVAFALYWLFESVDKLNASLVVILGGFMVCPIYFLNSLNWVAALVLVHGDDVAPAFSGPQRDELVMLFMRLHHYGVIVSLVFAGLWLFPIGVLVIKSGFLPKVLGIWLLLAGCTWLVQSMTAILLPHYADVLDNIAMPIDLGEVVFMLWLLIMGAKERPIRPHRAA